LAHRQTAHRSFATDSTVSEMDPGVPYRCAGRGASGGIQGARTVRPIPDGGGAVFTYSIELKPIGAGALGPLLVPLLRSGLRKDLKRLKALLERT
jgi:hypothetical protein